jgi:hypothetical protein
MQATPASNSVSSSSVSCEVHSLVSAPLSRYARADLCSLMRCAIASPHCANPAASNHAAISGRSHQISHEIDRLCDGLGKQV